MPTYDYYCEQCDITQEEFHSITDKPKILCPKCNEQMEIIISGGLGFILGEGFPGKEWKKVRNLKNLKYKEK